MNAAKRMQNEKEFGAWTITASGGRRYWFDVVGRIGGKARYLKEVDDEEITIAFWQEIYDQQGVIVEIHEKYPIDKR